jgi:hypothetical protein
MASKREPLSVTHPELAAQAVGWDPTTITAGNDVKRRWRCERNHEWDAPTYSRAGRGDGCPYCSGRQVIPGETDLATMHPELALQADGWDPTSVTSGSGKRLQWRCSANHSWVAQVASRANGGGCPFCAGSVLVVGVNDLATNYPELALQADGWDPTSVRWGSDVKLPWKCSSGHTWIAAVVKRSRAGRGCPYCSNNKVLPGYNDLKTHHPEISREAFGWDPSCVSKQSKKKLEWKCSTGHRWFATVGSRTAAKTGCPVCGNKKTVTGINDLETLYPALALEAFGWNPNVVNPGSNIKRDWICKLGHVWKAQVATRTQRGFGCPICSNQQLLKGFNDLATTHPEVAAEAYGWDPSTVIGGTHTKKMWKCSHGHVYEQQVQNRRRGGGCPYCANQQLLKGFNDLATTHPEVAAEAFGWDPTTVIGGTHTKKLWKCSQGHTWETSPKKRAFGVMNSCPICGNKQVLVGYNDLATINPALAAEADGWDARTVTYSSGKIRKWKCSEGHSWNSTVANRSNGSGCPSCAKSGFDPNKDGWLYFIRHDVLDMVQIGISNFPETRLGDHSKRGWEVLEVRGPMDGHLTQRLETAILHAVERRGAVLGHKAQIEKFDGYSEAWTKSSLSVNSLKQLLDWVYEDDQNSALS